MASVLPRKTFSLPCWIANDTGSLRGHDHGDDSQVYDFPWLCVARWLGFRLRSLAGYIFADIRDLRSLDGAIAAGGERMEDVRSVAFRHRSTANAHLPLPHDFFREIFRSRCSRSHLNSCYACPNDQPQPQRLRMPECQYNHVEHPWIRHTSSQQSGSPRSTSTSQLLRCYRSWGTARPSSLTQFAWTAGYKEDLPSST